MQINVKFALNELNRDDMSNILTLTTKINNSFYFYIQLVFEHSNFNNFFYGNVKEQFQLMSQNGNLSKD